MKHLNSIFPVGIMIFFILIGCIQDSPLSDIEIDDPSLIAPEIKLKRNRDENGILTSNIEVWLFDKNHNSIRLKNGDVRINDIPLDLTNAPLTNNAYYYSATGLINIEINTDYNFEIELSDGGIYTASVHTPENDLNSLNLPQNYTTNSDMVISWGTIYHYDEMKIKIENHYINSGNQGTETKKINIPPQYIPVGSYGIDKEFFTGTPGVNSTQITLTGKEYGNIDDRFRDESKIYTEYFVAKETGVN